MNLEKATSHSSEAGLAGWISSNDVTLFTVVVVVGIALFLQANLIKGSRANARLEDEKTSLANRNLRDQEEIRRIANELSATNLRLTSARDSLAKVTADLRATQAKLEEATNKLKAAQADLAATQQERDRVAQERKKLDEQLAGAMKQVQELKTSLDQLLIDKNNLVAASQKLEKEKGDVSKEKDSLAQAKATVEANLAELAAKLQQRLKELGDLQKERDLLDEQAKALAERVKKLELQVSDSEKNLANVKKTSETELAELKELLARALERHKSDQAVSAQEMQATVARATTAETQAADYLDRLRRAAALFKTEDENKKLLQLQIEALKTQLANALDDMQQMRRREVTLNRELIGLRGGLRRVAILFDSSGSMGQSGRWDEVHKIAGTWLDHLEVDECVLIIFSSGVTTFPSDGSLLRVSGKDGEANRKQMSDFLKAVKPEGWTNTLAAMQTAYRYPNLDTIILFSDGAPTIANSGRFDPEAAKQIYQLCQQHAKIPVNAIGLGNYFDPEFSTFLRTVAQLTNGTFVGR